MVLNDILPGPCYPNWPETNGAFAVHRYDLGRHSCRYCGRSWPELLGGEVVNNNEGGSPPEGDG